MTATKGGRQRRERIKVSLFACLSQCLRPKLSSPMPPRSSAVGCPIKGGRQTVSRAKRKENNCKKNVVVIILEDSAITISRRELLLRRECILTTPCCVSGPVGKHLFPSLCKHVCIPSVFPHAVVSMATRRPADLSHLSHNNLLLIQHVSVRCSGSPRSVYGSFCSRRWFFFFFPFCWSGEGSRKETCPRAPSGAGLRLLERQPESRARGDREPAVCCGPDTDRLLTKEQTTWDWKLGVLIRCPTDGVVCLGQPHTAAHQLNHRLSFHLVCVFCYFPRVIFLFVKQPRLIPFMFAVASPNSSVPSANLTRRGKTGRSAPQEFSCSAAAKKKKLFISLYV